MGHGESEEDIRVERKPLVEDRRIEGPASLATVSSQIVKTSVVGSRSIVQRICGR